MEIVLPLGFPDVTFRVKRSDDRKHDLSQATLAHFSGS